MTSCEVVCESVSPTRLSPRHSPVQKLIYLRASSQRAHQDDSNEILSQNGIERDAGASRRLAAWAALVSRGGHGDERHQRADKLISLSTECCNEVWFVPQLSSSSGGNSSEKSSSGVVSPASSPLPLVSHVLRMRRSMLQASSHLLW